MHWLLSHRADPEAREFADRHYNRQKVGSRQFVPPGRCLVLKTATAFWVTSYPYAEYVRHRWAGAFVCSAFRNEGNILSSTLIKEALACTRYKWPDVPPLGLITFVDPWKVRLKKDPGYCFIMAGGEYDGETKGGLVAIRFKPEKIPKAAMPIGGEEMFL